MPVHSDSLSLAALLARYPRRRGTAAIRSILAAGATRNHAHQERAPGAVRSVPLQRGLPRPRAERSASPLPRAGSWRSTASGAGARVIAELDLRAVHGTVAAFERDRSRHRALNAAAWRVVRTHLSAARCCAGDVAGGRRDRAALRPRGDRVAFRQPDSRCAAEQSLSLPPKGARDGRARRWRLRLDDTGGGRSSLKFGAPRRRPGERDRARGTLASKGSCTCPKSRQA